MTTVCSNYPIDDQTSPTQSNTWLNIRSSATNQQSVLHLSSNSTFPWSFHVGEILVNHVLSSFKNSLSIWTHKSSILNFSCISFYFISYASNNQNVLFITLKLPSEQVREYTVFSSKITQQEFVTPRRQNRPKITFSRTSKRIHGWPAWFVGGN